MGFGLGHAFVFFRKAFQMQEWVRVLERCNGQESGDKSVKELDT